MNGLIERLLYLMIGGLLMLGFQSGTIVVSEPNDVSIDSTIRYDAKFMYIVTPDTCLMSSTVQVKCIEGIKPWRK